MALARGLALESSYSTFVPASYRRAGGLNHGIERQGKLALSRLRRRPKPGSINAPYTHFIDCSRMRPFESGYGKRKKPV